MASQVVYDNTNRIVGVFKTSPDASAFANRDANWTAGVITDNVDVDVGWFIDTSKIPYTASKEAPTTVVTANTLAVDKFSIHQAFLDGQNSLPQYRWVRPIVAVPREDTVLASKAALTSPAKLQETEYQIDLTADSISSPYAVSSNSVTIGTGMEPFIADFDWHIHLDPTGWESGSGSGGNRAFLDVYWKKNDSIIPESVESIYIRGDEDWSPSDHKVHGSFSTILTASDVLTFFFKPTSISKAGAEINNFAILSSESHVGIHSQIITKDVKAEALIAASNYIYHNAALAAVIAKDTTTIFSSVTGAARQTLLDHIIDGYSRLANTRYAEFITDKTKRESWAKVSINDGATLYSDLCTTAGAVRTGDGSFTSFSTVSNAIIPLKFTPEHPDLT